MWAWVFTPAGIVSRGKAKILRIKLEVVEIREKILA
jgi:hypothetical protein